MKVLRYKFDKRTLRTISDKLQLVISLRTVKSELFILLLLRKIEAEKDLFVLEVE